MAGSEAPDPASTILSAYVENDPDAHTALNILFLSNYFPPEVNAPANRLADHVRVWVEDEHGVEILTAVPNFPEGRVYPSYANRLTIEAYHGARVTRVPVFASPNRGTMRRTLSYLSFMVSAILYRRRIRSRPDVVVATSPQFFAGIAGAWIASRFDVPFVLEIRDLWPDSIVAVGALPDSLVIRTFRRIERWLYRRADHVVAVTDAFVDALKSKGVPPDKVSVVKNGVDLETVRPPSHDRRRTIRENLGIDDRFVASYVGTLGMAHGADVLLDAAALAASSDAPDDDRFVFLLAGDGSERRSIEERLRERDTGNAILLEKQSREGALDLVAASDASVVHLRDRPLFRTVLPSKMFEAMALGRPIILGVDGEARRTLEASGAGVFVPPENPEALLTELRRLRDDDRLRTRLEAAGPPFIREHFNRRLLARRYADILAAVARDGRSSAR